MPGYFYKTLKNYISSEQVPVTLYPENPPSYSKPLQLYVKIKTIQLDQNYLSTDGVSYIQPLKIVIYGQVTDKTTGNVLIKFYDSAQTIFMLGKDQTNQALKEVSDQLMKDFALYLRTKY